MYESPIILGSKPCTLNIPGMGVLHGLTVLDENGKEKCHRFTGIRYAKPPVGKLRWRRPVTLEDGYDYSGDYNQFKTICPQPFYNNRKNQVRNPDFKYDEDCLFLNIWVPAGEKPAEGWPVLYFIHGGWLQVGNPLHYRQCDPQDLQADGSPAKFILVSPGHRLNLFGFLAGKELLEEDPKSSNFGFWDQRLGLEWTYKHIESFGGNKENIAVGGISAGSYSALFQLIYETYHPEANQIIKRALLLSNGLSVQPKSVEESQIQFNELAQKFGIPLELSSAEKLEKLRAIPFQDLADNILNLRLHTFRAVTDGDFVNPNTFKDIYDGTFGKRIRDSGRELIIGEVNNEHSIYANTNPPKSKEDLFNQVNNYYPEKVTKALLELYPKVPDMEDEKEYLAAIKALFGSIVSDMQVYASTRVLINGLVKGGVPLEKIYRYRIAFRGKFFDKYEPPESLVPHAGDLGLWFYNVVDGILPEEIPIYKAWLKSYGEWMSTGKTDWGTTKTEEYRLLDADGTIKVVDDEKWDWGLKVGRTVAGVFGLN
ncbi:COesterase domain-containing protein [Schizosaccharomyces pombe]|uniref:Uncharacterized esterase/lipase C417.12 n=1 Tax=Schizosaccharomyces pombe (strain 972 / ATCC 24843) TaxID=284812 RepID=YC7C_SCHPO|nr:carboxylesterase-lipase family protein [Schizosaccharomyces pombe]O94493.2 RecName: Full=Uncharacterized esterase/lipase C417.12 [Schizosaccharomyces pombe 972h-]CAA22658.2 carboxylesterase-lipase family protein [Schizosaccharomyces pombe]|eukprot:NP_588289.2 carboxylesterase-lipase family protein [Schizosaccharomyces pombe]